jgi:exonuclease VII small subunit
MSKKKDKESKDNMENLFKLQIEEKISNIKDRINNLDYSKGLQEGMTEYDTLVTEIKETEKGIKKIQEYIDKQKFLSTDQISIIDDGEFKAHLDSIPELIKVLESITNLNDAIKKYAVIKNIIESCRKYEENIKMTITKIE